MNKMNIWYPESLYFGCLAYSVLLMTSALLFYHMTRTKTLELNSVAAGIFAIGLIFIAFMFVATGIYTYYKRILELQKDSLLSEIDKNILQREKNFWIFYLVFGILFMMIQFFIAFFIIKGSIESISYK